MRQNTNQRDNENQNNYFKDPANWSDEDIALEKGLVATLARNDKTKMSQVRKIFAELNNLYSLSKKSENIDEIKKEVLMLFPKINYAKNREVLKYDLYVVLKNWLNYLYNELKKGNKKPFEKFHDFLTALISYKKD